MRCGTLPLDLGLVELAPTEMMFWMYCPIKHPGAWNVTLPDNLKQFIDIVLIAREDSAARWEDSYVYVTAKTLFVCGGAIGNRPGWHSDGFGSDDVNYIWSDRAPTEFVVGDWEFSKDHNESLLQMDAVATLLCEPFTYPNKHLLRLDPRVIHRSPEEFEPGMRSFVKVSVSKDQYNLVGNSINHDLPAFHLKPRGVERNHPTA